MWVMCSWISIQLQDMFFTWCFWNHGPIFLEIQRVSRYCRQTLHIQLFRDLSLQPPNMNKHWHKHAPRNTPKSDKIHVRKNTDFWHRFWFDFDFKNDPKMTPKSSKMPPLGSQGAPWDRLGEPGGPPGASRPTFGSNLAPQTSQNEPTWP